ncbi:lysophospholipid acyltransferase family protein [Sulfuriferula plumbiphila]|nr:lysophospholipid acyltransferase family protein [Sulfuriferula plumbiphila]
MLRVLRLGGVVVLVLVGLLILAGIFPWASRAARAALTMRWSRILLATLGIRLRVSGTAPEVADGGVMFAANHLSWLDPFLVLAHCPAHFVAKSEVRSWPVLGWLAAQSGTLFIERERRQDVARISTAFTRLLRAGENVGLFPESTTGDGTALNPFKPALLQAACAAGARLCPVAIRYVDQAGRAHPAPIWVGEMSFADSILRIAAARGIVAELTFCPCMAGAHQTRRALALQAETAIASVLSLSVPRIPPETPADPPGAMQ